MDADINDQCIIVQGTHNDTICVLRGYGYGCLTPLFNNISVISWRKVHNGGGNGLPVENCRPAAIHLHTLSHNVVPTTPRHERKWKSQLLTTHNHR